MAISLKESVIVTTTATGNNNDWAQTVNICGVLYMPAATGDSAAIRQTAGVTGGTVLWQSSGGTRTYDHVDLRIGSDGMHVDVSGNGTLYIYTETD